MKLSSWVPSILRSSKSPSKGKRPKLDADLCVERLEQRCVLTVSPGVDPAQGAAAQAAAETARQVIFVESDVADYQSLVAGVTDSAEVVLLDQSQNGLTQMADYLSGQAGQYDAIHIISHGAAGQLNLGTSVIDAAAIGAYSEELATIGSALTADGDLLLYGCDVAAGAIGSNFLTQLADATGADVAASVDPTGNAALGGDWDLEANVGAIESGHAIGAAAAAGYEGLLASISGTVAGQTVNDNSTTTPFSGVVITGTGNVAVTITLDDDAKGALSGANFTFAAGVYTLDSGLDAAAAEAAIRSLVLNPANDRVAPGDTETTTFTITANDGTPATDSTTTVISTSVNDIPTITGAIAGQAVNDTGTISPFAGVTIDDLDNPDQSLTVQVSLDAAAKGTFSTLSGFTLVSPGVYEFVGTASDATTAIRGMVFDPADNRVAPNTTETTTFTITANDTLGSAAPNSTTTVVSTSVNDAPTISGALAGQAVNDNATISPFSGVTIVDVDAQNVTVTVTLDTAAKGTFSTLNGFSNMGAGVYQFIGTATAATTAIQGLVFDPTNDRVAVGSTETTTFTISVNDGVAAPVTNNTTTVVSTSVNDVPTITGVVAGQAVNDNSTIMPFAGVTIGDNDNPAQTLIVRVTLDIPAQGTFSTLNGFTNLGSGVYEFSGTAAAATTAIRGLVFDPAENQVSPTSTQTTTFTISADDPVAAPVTNSITTVVATSVNDAPTITGAVAGQTVSDDSTIQPFSGVTIGDVDSPAQTLTVQVTLDDEAKGVFSTLSGFTDLGSGVYEFSGTAAAATTAIRGLVFNPTNDRVAVGDTETTTFTISVDDGIAAAVTDNTTTVISSSGNDAPTITGAVAGQGVNDTGTIAPFTAVTIGDTDTPAQTLTVTVTLDVAAKGTFSTLNGFTSMGAGVYEFTGTAAAATTAIRGLIFDPTNNRVAPTSTETTTFTISVDDGTAAPATNNTTTVVSTSINDAPSITGTVAGQAVNDNATVQPFSAVTIIDVDVQNVTVTVTLDTAAKGQFTTLSGFTNLGGGVYQFVGTSAAATTAIRGLVYDPTNDRVAVGSTETSSFTIEVDDGIATPATDGTTTVVSTSINDLPTITGTVAGQAVNDNATILPFAGVTIGDTDNPAQTLIVQVTLDSAAKGAFTTLNGFVDMGGGVYQFTGTAAAATTAIRGLVYDPTNDRVAVSSTETTTFTISADDPFGAPVTNNTTTVVSTSINDLPTITGAVAGQTVNDNATILPFGGVTIGDVDNPAQTLVVRVTLDTAAKGTFTTLNGFTSLGGGVYEFTGTAAAATTAIRGLVFDPTNDRVAPGSTETTTFTISADDPFAAPVTNNVTTVISTSINDAPSISGSVADQAVNDNATIQPFSAVTITDVDVQNVTVTVTLDDPAKGLFTTLNGFTNLGGGVYQFVGSASAATTAIRGMVYNPTNDRVAVGLTETSNFTIDVDDGIATVASDSTTTVVSTSINDLPTITGTVAGQVVNDTATIAPFAGVTIGDVDNPAQILVVQVTLDTAAKGTFTTLNGFSDLGGGVYEFTGTAAAATTAIRGMIFDPANDRVAPGATETTTFTISVDDPFAAPVTNNTTTVISTSINDAPTIAGTVAGQAVNDNATILPFATVTIGDVDVQNVTVTVTLDVAAKGTFSTLNGFTNLGGGVYQFTGSAAAATTAIRGLVFDPTNDRVAVGLTETTTFTINVNDGIAPAVTDNTTTVISTSINDLPTIVGTVAGQAVNDNATISPFSGVTIGDVDNPAQTLVVRVTLDTAAKGTFTTLNGFTDLGGGVYEFTGTAAAATTAIRGLVFDPTNDRVGVGLTETTTFTISVDDPFAAPVTDSTTTVISTSINDLPTITGTLAGQTVNDNATIAPFAGVTIGDVDNPAQTLVVRVTLDTAAKGVFSTLNGFTDLGGGVYEFTGTAAAATTAIRGLVFNPTNDRVAPGATETTTFTISADDPFAAPVTNSTTTVISTSINDPPTITGTVAGQPVNDNATILPFATVTIGDVDVQNVTVTVTLDAAAKGVFSTLNGFTDLGGGVYEFTGTAAAATTAIRGLVFNPTNDRVAVGLTETTTFTINVDDGIAAQVTDNTTTVVSTSVNDLPTIVGTVAGQTVNDNATISPFSGVTIGDVDNPAQTLVVRVTLDTAAKGTFTTLNGFTDLGGGVYEFTGTAAAATTAIRGLVFDPTNDRVGVGLTETTTFTISVDDPFAAPVINSTTTVISTSINDLPTITGTVAGQTVNDNATIAPFAGVTIGDVDNPAQTLVVRVTLDTAAKGVFSTLNGFTDLGGGVYEFTGTAATATTAIRGLVFNPTNDRVAVGLTETTTFTISVDDPFAPPVTDSTTTVISTSINDIPTITGTVAGQAVNDNATILPFSGVTIGDVDNPAQTLVVRVTLDSAAKGVFTTLNGFTDLGGGVYEFTGTAAAATTAIRGLVFDPTDNRVAVGLTETTTFTISAEDPFAAPVTDSTTTVISTSINDAPVLDNTGTMTLDTILEDLPAVSNTGTLVSTIIASASLPDRITDLDPSSLEGIAVTGLDTTNGTWQYSLDGTTWIAFGAVSDANATLLALDGNTRIRFLPSANFFGTVTNGITFRAWDQSNGLAEGTTGVNVGTNGGNTPYSSATESADITVIGVNDPPNISLVTAPTAINEGSTGFFEVLINEGPVNERGIQDLLAQPDGVQAAVLISTDVAIVSITDQGGGIWRITYEGIDDATPSIRVTATDNGGTANGGIDSAFLDVGVVVNNVAPVLSAPVLVDAGGGTVTAIVEGDTVHLTFDITDPGIRDTYSVTIVWGDGQSETISVGAATAGTQSIDVTHTYLDDDADDTYAITITVTDDDTGVDTDGRNITVTNDEPQFVPSSIVATDIKGDFTTTVTGYFTDAGINDVHTMTIDWGGLELPSTLLTGGGISIVSLGNGLWSFTATHTYQFGNPDSTNNLAPITISFAIGDDDGPTPPVGFLEPPIPAFPVFGSTDAGDVGSVVAEVNEPLLPFFFPTINDLNEVAQVITPQVVSRQEARLELPARDDLLLARASSGAVASTETKVILYLIKNGIQIQKLEAANLETIEGLLEKLPDGRYRVVFRQDGVDRPVLDIYVRQGRLETPSDDPEEAPQDPTPIRPEIQGPKGADAVEALPETQLSWADEVDAFWERAGEQAWDATDASDDLDLAESLADAKLKNEDRQRTGLDTVESLLLLGSITAAGGALAARASRSRSERVEALMERLGQ